MALTSWADLVLCEPSDIKSEIGSLDIALQEHDASKQEAVYNEIYADAKLELADMIDEYLPELFASKSVIGWGYGYDNWISLNGFDALDTLRDKIFNPQVLNTVMRAIIIGRMFIRGDYTYTITIGHNDDALQSSVQTWNGKDGKRNGYKHQRFDLAMRLLKIDLNQDGEITTDERVDQNLGLLNRI